MLADVDSISLLISARLHSWSLLVFDGEGGGLVFESFLGPILFNYNKNITKLIAFNENCVSWYVLLFAYCKIE